MLRKDMGELANDCTFVIALTTHIPKGATIGMERHYPKK